MDLPAIAGALASINNVLNIAKTIEDQKISIAINSAISDTLSKLIIAQQQLSDIQTENQRLREELNELKRDQDFESSVVFHDGVYWRKTIQDKEEGPFCPTCWGMDKKLVLLSIYEADTDPMVLWCIHHDSRKSAAKYKVSRALAGRLAG